VAAGIYRLIQTFDPRKNQISGPEIRILGYQLAGRNATAEE
jgi:hypothetical protein